jgi:hypothetical protein
MTEIITFCATVKGKIPGRSMDFEQRGESSSIYFTDLTERPLGRK